MLKGAVLAPSGATKSAARTGTGRGAFFFNLVDLGERAEEDLAALGME
jgi:hypothetical protein